MIVVVGKKETVLAFGLVGVNEIYEVNTKTKKEDLESFLLKMDPTLLIVDEYTYDRFQEVIDKLKEKTVIVEVPSYNYKGKSKERFKRLIKEAFGVELNI